MLGNTSTYGWVNEEEDKEACSGAGRKAKSLKLREFSFFFCFFFFLFYIGVLVDLQCCISFRCTAK